MAAYQKEQMSLVIKDTFKGQDINDLGELCAKRNWEIVIIPHNLTNKFQPLDPGLGKLLVGVKEGGGNCWSGIMLVG